MWVYDQDYLRTVFDSSLKSFMHDLISLQVSSNYEFGLVYWIDLSGNLPEEESIMEGFYINTIASPMKRE